MVWGMTFYRSYDLDKALRLFELARRIATIIHDSGTITNIGTLARCWYCIGLVHREKRTKEARAAFRQSIELASKGIQDRRANGESPASFDYNLARCCGLGMGWIAYNEALLTEAAGALFMARRMMDSIRAKFIAKYLDVVQATIMMSESAEASRIREALALLIAAYATFDPPGTLGNQQDKDSLLRHTHYALRCLNEIAMGHLHLARACQDDPRQHEENLTKAEVCVYKVKKAAKLHWRTAIKTYCTALIIEARIKCERARHEKDPSRARDLNTAALKLAEEAGKKGSGIKSILIDASIGTGEAELALGLHAKAIASFQGALDKGKENRKDAAVCHLHLCRCYLSVDDSESAAEHFKLCELIKRGLENVFIANLAEEVRKTLFHTYQKFELSKEEVIRGRDSTEYLNSLRKWLAETAVALENGNHRLAAERLVIGERALNNWLEF
jgi:tetratricopeptide (TPR) repeat protein